MDSSPIESLPTEILQKILRYLPVRDRIRAERVCKKWKNVSTEVIWSDVEVIVINRDDENYYEPGFLTLSAFNESNKSHPRSYSKFCTEETLLKMIQSSVSRAGQHVKQFVYENMGDENSELLLSIIAEHCNRMESIHFEWIHHSEVEVFLRLLKNNEQLHSITGNSHPVDIVEILPLRDWKSLNFENIYNLTYIQSRWIVNFGEESPVEQRWEDKVVALIENSPSLEKFSIRRWTSKILTALSKCEQLKDLCHPVKEEIPSKNLMMHTSLVNRLTCLKIGDIQGFIEDANEDDLVDLLRHCIHLENLQLYLNTYEISDRIQEAVLALPKLESLSINGHHHTDEFLDGLLKLKNLRFSERDAITENGIFEMITTSKCIERLEIHNDDLTIELFERLAQNVRERHVILMINRFTGDGSEEFFIRAREICEGSGLYIFPEYGSNYFMTKIKNW